MEVMVKRRKIEKETDILDFKVLNYRYKNINNLDLNHYRNIKDFTFISKLERLEILSVNDSNFSDIPFLGKNKNNKNIKELYLENHKNIKGFIPISKFEKLEILNINQINISDISFLEKNKNIKELHLENSKNIKDFTPISKLEREIYISDLKKKILKNYF